MREIFFHEDDYCQLELVAEQNRDWCVEEMKRVRAFSEAHQAEVGWTDIYVRNDPGITFDSLGISRGDWEAALPQAMPSFDRVLTGYGSKVEACSTILAHGAHPGLVAFAALGERDLVTAVWFTFDLQTDEDVPVACDLLKSASRWPVFLADWGWCQQFDRHDADGLARYFQKRFEVFGGRGA